MPVVAIINHKGGVGKTTTAVNLGGALQSIGKRVLLVDLDPQASLSIHLGIRHPETLPANCGHVLKSAVGGGSSPTLQDVLVKSPVGIDLIPSGWQLDDAEALLGHGQDWAFVLRECLSPLREAYDFVLIDCLPGRNFLVYNAVTAADAVLVPLQADHLAAQGLALTFHTAVTVQERFNPGLEVLGILLTMVDSRTNHSRRVVASVRETFAGKIRVFDTLIRAQVGLKESSKAGTTVLDFNPASPPARAYRGLATEVVAACEEMGLGANGSGRRVTPSSALAEATAIALAQAEELAWAEEPGEVERVPRSARGGEARVAEPPDAAAAEVPAPEAEREPEPEPAPEPEPQHVLVVAAPVEPVPLPPTVVAAPDPPERHAETVAEEGARPVDLARARARAVAPAHLNVARTPTPQVTVREAAPVSAVAPADICPYLGLSDDRTKRLAKLNYAHRCWVDDVAVAVDLPTQQRTCLQSWYRTCPRYVRGQIGQTESPLPKVSLVSRLTSWLRTSR